MSKPLHLTAPDPRPRRRRCLWAEELRRFVAYFNDMAARDREARDAAQALAMRRIGDLQDRLTDLKRATGTSDLRKPPGPGRVWRH